jgi:monoamine oxidase
VDDQQVQRLTEAIHALREDVREDIRDTRAELREARSEVRAVGSRVTEFDSRVNGRIGRLEDEQAAHRKSIGHLQEQVGREMHVAARAQGAAEERQQLGMPASALPPPVAASAGPQSEPKWARTFAIVAGGLSTLAGAIALILGGGPH